MFCTVCHVVLRCRIPSDETLVNFTKHYTPNNFNSNIFYISHGNWSLKSPRVTFSVFVTISHQNTFNHSKINKLYAQRSTKFLS